MRLLRLPRAVATLMLGTMVAVGAWAAEVAGMWKGTSESGTEIVLNLKTEGGKVTGTASLNGTEKPISDGKAEKDQISFTMPSLFGNGVVTATGKLEGEEMRLSLNAPVGVVKANLKRQS